MSTLLSLVATGVLIVLGLWLLGSIVLRVGGAVLAVGGLVSTAATGSPAMAAVTILGALAWLAGHWLFERAPSLLPLAAGAACLPAGAPAAARSDAAVGHSHGPSRAAVEQPTAPARDVGA